MLRIQHKLHSLLRSINEASKADEISRGRYLRILASGIAGSIGKFSIALIGLISIPMVVQYLGKDQYAVWLIISSLVVWMQLADFGIGNGLTNALSEANGRDSNSDATGYLTTALITTFGLSCIFFPLFYVSSNFISWGWLLNIDDPELSILAADAMLLVGSAFIFNIPISLATRVYVAYQKAFVVSLSQIISSILTLLGIWFAINANLNLVWIVGISACVPIFINFMLWFGFSWAGISIGLNWAHIRINHLLRVAKSSIPIFLFQCGGLFVNELVNVVIAQISTLAMVADYNIIRRIYLFVFTLAASFTNPFYPAIREAFERGHFRWVSRAIRNGLILRLLVTMPASFILLILGDRIVEAWIGKSGPAPIGVYGWLSIVICMWLSSISSLLSEVLTSLDDIWAQIFLVFISAVLVVVCMTFLIPYFGVPGIFMAMIISTFPSIAWLSKRILFKFK